MADNISERISVIGGFWVFDTLPEDNGIARGVQVGDFILETDTGEFTIIGNDHAKQPISFFLPSAGGTGFDIGGYGAEYGDDTTVTSSAYTSTSNSLIKPNYAVVGWGALENTNLDLVETLVDRIVVLEAA